MKPIKLPVTIIDHWNELIAYFCPSCLTGYDIDIRVVCLQTVSISVEKSAF